MSENVEEANTEEILKGKDTKSNQLRLGTLNGWLYALLVIQLIFTNALGLFFVFIGMIAGGSAGETDSAQVLFSILSIVLLASMFYFAVKSSAALTLSSIYLILFVFQVISSPSSVRNVNFLVTLVVSIVLFGAFFARFLKEAKQRKNSGSTTKAMESGSTESEPSQSGYSLGSILVMLVAAVFLLIRQFPYSNNESLNILIGLLNFKNMFLLFSLLGLVSLFVKAPLFNRKLHIVLALLFVGLLIEGWLRFLFQLPAVSFFVSYILYPYYRWVILLLLVFEMIRPLFAKDQGPSRLERFAQKLVFR
ncbi:hypothetical protein [Saccharibacillus sacchari]|uniref:Uncharacterized protein n=1 Tax=Saccharibacillus sacchari TaxID=456493 RepID=A0ACC6P7A2_9BACL